MEICVLIWMNISIRPLWCLLVVHLTSISVRYPISFAPSGGDSKCAIMSIAVSSCYATASHGDNRFSVLHTCFNFISETNIMSDLRRIHFCQIRQRMSSKFGVSHKMFSGVLKKKNSPGLGIRQQYMIMVIPIVKLGQKDTKKNRWFSRQVVQFCVSVEHP